MPDITTFMNTLTKVNYAALTNPIQVTPKDMAILRMVDDYIGFHGITLMNPIPTICNISRIRHLKVSGTGDECSCDLSWLVMARDMGLHVTTQNKECGGTLWTELNITSFMEVCHWDQKGFQEETKQSGSSRILVLFILFIYIFFNTLLDFCV